MYRLVMMHRMVMNGTVMHRMMSCRVVRPGRRRRKAMVLRHRKTGQRQGDEPNH